MAAILKRPVPLTLSCLALIGLGIVFTLRVTEREAAAGHLSCSLSVTPSGSCGQYYISGSVSSPSTNPRYNTTSSGDGASCNASASSPGTPAACGFTHTYANGSYTATLSGSGDGESCSREVPVSVSC